MKDLRGEQIRFPKCLIKVGDLLQDYNNERFYQASDPENKSFLLKVFEAPEKMQNFQDELQGVRIAGLHGKLLIYIDSIESQDFLGILYEHIGRFTLGSILQSAALNDSQINTMLRDILLAFHYLHTKKIVHRGLTKNSIFVTQNFKFKLGDFSGICNENELKSSSPKLPQELQAPEMLISSQEGIVWTCALDLWCLGCVLYEILYSQSAFLVNDIESQLRGKYRKSDRQVSVYWKLVLDRLLDPNPQTRASISEIITLIHESYMPSMTSAESVDFLRPVSMFKKSTSSWVKAVIANNEQAPDQIYMVKLLGKAWNKPTKIPLFFQALLQRQFTKAPVALKSLIVLFKYVSYGPKSVLVNQIGRTAFIEEMEKIWQGSEKNKGDKGYSDELGQLINNAVELVSLKFRLHTSLKISGDWSDFRNMERDAILQILVYWENSIKTVKSLLLSPEIYRQIKSSLITLLLHEHQVIILELNQCISSFPLDLNNSFQANQRETLSLLENFKACYPNQIIIKIYSTDSNINKPSENPQKTSSNTDIKPVESSKTQGNFVKRKSILQTDFSWIININELELQQNIGAGSSCTVYQGVYRQTAVAVKILRNKSQNAQKEFEREVETMVKLKHPNLVQFIGASIEKELCIVTEFCFGDTLFKLLHEDTDVKLSYKQLLKMAKDVAKGMEFLHIASIIHRDLKSLNLLLDKPIKSPEDKVHIKIMDFGISRSIDDGLLTGQMGTCHWMAPEILANQSYGFPADVYSYGMVLWEIFVREAPYRGINVAMIPYQVLHMGLRPDMNRVKNETIKGLIVRCLSHNASNRPSFSEIIQCINGLQKAGIS